jgi:peptidoglycan/LPS O-acetylase OafA/YrhL
MSKSFGDPSLGVTWSLAIEEQFYLILPLLIRISKQYIKYIILAGIVIAPLIRYQLGGTAAYVLLPARIDSLLFGVGLAYLLVTGKLNWCLKRSKELLASVIMIIVLIAFLSIYTEWNRTGGIFNHSIYAILYSIILILTLQGSVNMFKKVLETPLLVYIGKVSYGLYLIHIPVLTIVFFLSSGQSPKLQGITDLFLIIISFVFCLLLLYLSYKYYETPIRNLGMKFSYQEK